MVEEAVRDARFLGDVADSRLVVAALGEDANGGAEQLLAPVGSRCRSVD